MRGPILHIVTKQLEPDLLKAGVYVPSEDIYCEATDVELHTHNHTMDGWATLDNIEPCLEKLDYKGYAICEDCMEHPVVAMWFLGDLP